MGNQQNHPVIQLVLGHSSIIAGEFLTGTANFKIPQTYQDFSVVLYLKGIEKNSFRLQNQVIEDKVFILNHKQVLFSTQGGKILAGNYSIPFKISTPKSIPGTFSCLSRKSLGKIKYRVEGRLFSTNQNLTSHKVLLIVKQAIDTARISIMGSAESSVRCCSCFDQGVCRMSAHLDKNAYLPGEDIIVKIAFDHSKTTARVTSIRVRLVRVLNLASKGGYSQVFRKVLTEKKSKVRFRSDSLMENSLDLSLNISQKKHSLSLTATTDGKIIRCRYQVEVSAFLGTFRTNGPIVDVPVLIFPNEIIQSAPSAPEDWNPVELPECVDYSNES
jgi:hypothetical protein